MKVLVAILAAGESRRMGSPKLCLPWKGTTVLGHLLTQWQEAGAGQVVVIHPQGKETPVIKELDRLSVPAAQRAATIAPERGMMGSVVTAAGLTRNESFSHLVIALGDQPHLRTRTLRGLVQECAVSRGKIVRLLFDGKPGHPLALPGEICAKLKVTDDLNLRDFLARQNCGVLDLTCEDSGVLLDVDTPDDFARASQLAD